MSKTINAALAALVLTTSVVTGASAAFASGDYYPGVSETPIVKAQAQADTGAKVGARLAGIEGGDGAYYKGVAHGRVDTMATGSIKKSNSIQPVFNKGDYYQGVSVE